MRMKLATVLLLSALNAAASLNLVQDGNFSIDPVNGGVINGPLSSGSPWTVSSTGASFGVYIVGLPDSLGPIDPLTIGSPDLGVSTTPYFVTDNGVNTLSQNVNGFVSGNTYEVSFDAYLAYTGAFNPYTPSFNVQLGGSTIANFPLTSLPIPASPADATAWTHFYSTFTAPSSGSLLLNFTFVAPGLGAAKDILLDRVYIGAPVSATPEPNMTLVCFGGVAACVVLARRRRVRDSL